MSGVVCRCLGFTVVEDRDACAGHGGHHQLKGVRVFFDSEKGSFGPCVKKPAEKFTSSESAQRSTAPVQGQVVEASSVEVVQAVPVPTAKPEVFNNNYSFESVISSAFQEPTGNSVSQFRIYGA